MSTTEILLNLHRTVNRLVTTVRQCSSIEDAFEFESAAARTVDEWTQRLSPISLVRYEYPLRRWCDWYENQPSADPILSPSSVVRYLRALAEVRLKPHTLVSFLHPIAALLRRAKSVTSQALAVLRESIRSANRQIPRTRRSPAPLRIDQILNLLSIVDRESPHQVRDAALLLIMYDTLTLPHELVGSQFGGAMAHALPRRAYTRTQGGGGRLAIPASIRDTSNRVLTLSASTADWVDAWISFGEAERALFPMAKNTLGSRLNRWLRRAGISPDAISPTSVRVGAIHDMLARGVNPDSIRDLARRLGDSFIARYVRGETATPAGNFDNATARLGANARQLRPITARSSPQLVLGF